MPAPACLVLLVLTSTTTTSSTAASPWPAATSTAVDPSPLSAETLDTRSVAPPTEPPAPLESPVLFEVAVRSRRTARTPGSAHVVRTRELERFEHDDVHQVLNAVPGVYVRGEDGVGLRPNIGIRGVNPDRSKKLTLLEDGILFAPAPYSAPAAYYFPMITRMSEVRVLKGPAAIGYGPHTVGGAIDLITRAVPTETAASLDLAGGMYGYGKLHAWAGARGERLSFLIEGVHLREDGFKTLPNPDASTGFYKNEWMAKASYTHDGPLDLRGELRLKLGYAQERSNETYVGLTDADFAADPLRRYGISQLDQMNYQRTSAVLAHTLHITPALQLTTTLYRHDLARTWRKVNGFRGVDLFEVLTRPDAADAPENAVYYELIAGRAESAGDQILLVGPNQREYVSQGVDLRLRADGETGPISHRVDAGLRLHYDRVERRHSEDGFRVVGDTLVPEGVVTDLTKLDEAATLAGALYVTDAVTWGALTVTPGIRAELIRSEFIDLQSDAASVRNHLVVLPGVGAHYAVLPELGVLAGVHRGFSPPAPVLGGDNQPELSVAYEAGVRTSVAGVRAELIGYLNDYSNLTDVCTASSGCQDQDVDRQFDAGRALVYGLEASATWAPTLSESLTLPLSASYTLTRAHFEADFESEDPIFGEVEAGDEIPYVPAHQAHLTLALEHPRATLGVSGTFVAAMRELAGAEPLEQVLATDALWNLDVSASVTLVGSLVLYANVRNVLDQQVIVSRRPFGARGSAPRWVQVGLKATL